MAGPKRDYSKWAPMKTYRCDPNLYEAVQAKAAAEGRTVTDVIISAFTEYVESED